MAASVETVVGALDGLFEETGFHFAENVCLFAAGFPFSDDERTIIFCENLFQFFTFYLSTFVHTSPCKLPSFLLKMYDIPLAVVRSIDASMGIVDTINLIVEYSFFR